MGSGLASAGLPWFSLTPHVGAGGSLILADEFGSLVDSAAWWLFCHYWWRALYMFLPASVYSTMKPVGLQKFRGTSVKGTATVVHAVNMQFHTNTISCNDSFRDGHFLASFQCYI